MYTRYSEHRSLSNLGSSRGGRHGRSAASRQRAQASRCGSTRPTTAKRPPPAHPGARRRRGPRGHRRRRRASPQHAGSRHPPRRGSRCAVPPRERQGTALRPHPRRGARRGGLPHRPRRALDRAGRRPRRPAAGGPGRPSGRRRPAQDPRPPQPHVADPGRGFLAPLHAAGLPGREAALAFRLIYDYTLGFALADPTSPAEQRLHDAATREQLHDFLRALPAAASRTWPPTASTPGTATATSASPPAFEPSCADCRRTAPGPEAPACLGAVHTPGRISSFTGAPSRSDADDFRCSPAR